MSDFRAALQAGMSVAKTAVFNKNEINSVIAEIEEQIIEFSHNKATFGLGTFNRKRSESPMDAFVSVLTPHPVETYEALAVWNSEGKSPIQLAEMSISENGYPCKITYDGNDVYCNNKEELIFELSALLSSGKTGKAILEKMEEYDKKNNPEE